MRLHLGFSLLRSLRNLKSSDLPAWAGDRADAKTYALRFWSTSLEAMKHFCSGKRDRMANRQRARGPVIGASGAW